MGCYQPKSSLPPRYSPLPPTIAEELRLAGSPPVSQGSSLFDLVKLKPLEGTGSATRMLSFGSLWVLQDLSPQREGERELAPLDGSKGHTGASQSRLGGLDTASVGRSVTSQARGLLALQGRDMSDSP